MNAQEANRRIVNATEETVFTFDKENFFLMDGWLCAHHDVHGNYSIRKCYIQSQNTLEVYTIEVTDEDIQESAEWREYCDE